MACVCSGQKVTPRTRLQQLSSALALDAAGGAPWHLRMSYDLFDLNGKQLHSGTLEEWWLSPRQYRIVIASPALSLTLPQKVDPVAELRESYLVRLLLLDTIHPIPDFSKDRQSPFSEVARSFGATRLSCFQAGQTTEMVQYCTDPSTGDLRAVIDGAVRSASRNAMAKFRNASISYDQKLYLVGKLAIHGHIDALEEYSPVASAITIDEVADNSRDVLKSPDLLTRTPPIYPDGVDIAGVVVVRELISKNGEPASVEVIASSDPKFTKAVTDTISKWKYKPMLRNGTPVSVSSTISVNFIPQGPSNSSVDVQIDEKIQDDVDHF